MVELKQQLLLKQTLTPQQILQSTILQLPTLALETRVKHELETNPVLEENLESLQELEEREELPERDVEQEDGDGKSKEEIEVPEEQNKEIEWEDILHDTDEFTPRYEYDKNYEEPNIPLPDKPELTDHLLEQVRLLPLSEEEVEIAQQIIFNINERGYLSVPVSTIAAQLQVSEDKLEKIRQQIMRLDPLGIGATSLQECLIVQLEEKTFSPARELALKIIKHAFDDFANKRYEKLMKQFDINEQDLREVEEEVRKLNPKPGSGYLNPFEGYIVPDLIVEKVDDDFVITVNDSHIPELRISSSYLDMLKSGKKLNSEARNYLKKKVDGARWFIQAIQQRRLTMIKVMKAIIERQRDFFEGNTNKLNPMILKDIAEDVNMDISTISRVTNGKYVQCPQGVFELKYFFSEGMTDAEGEEVSTKTIKDLLKKLIEEEDKRKPLSDDKLAKLLAEKGYPIARRTVAKYREQMKIPVARLRRSI